MTKLEMLDAGIVRMKAWCALNHVTVPAVEITREPAQFGVCAYYRDSVIYISPSACAGIGRAGRAWSYPGHQVDRTPFGVIQHELGHHVDGAHGARPGRMSSRFRQETGEKPLTSYCPNDNEWFAEMFRLFVTNPDLLRALRPRTYGKMSVWLSVELRPWDRVLAGADRQIAVLRKRIKSPVGSELFA